MWSSPVRARSASSSDEPLGQRLAAGDLALLGLPLELLDDLRGRAGADVGVDQRLLEPLPRLLVEVALEQRGLDLGLAAPRASCACSRACGGRSRGAPARAPPRAAARGPAAVGDEEVVPVSRHGTRENRAMPDEITVRAEAADSLIAVRLVDAMVAEMEQLYSLAPGTGLGTRRRRRTSRRRAARSSSSTRAASRWRAAASSATRTASPRSSACTSCRGAAAAASGGGCSRSSRTPRASSATRGSGSTPARASRTRRRCTSAPATTRSTNYNGNSQASFWGEKILR